ncbi:MAG: ATP-binding protein [Bryobacteraceae bacterium]
MSGWELVEAVTLQREHDIVTARHRTRRIAEILGFDPVERTKLATAVSEIARNALMYAREGRVEYFLEGQTSPQLFLVRVSDEGSGIPNLTGILAGDYRPESGLGMGLMGARRLVEQFQIDSVPGGGTSVYLRKRLPKGAPVFSDRRLRHLTAELTRGGREDIVGELQRQNRELLRALSDLRTRQEELTRLNQDLEDTNRGVIALHAELDESNSQLRKAVELKTEFFHYMSHEFRTPINSILALSGLLLSWADGDLTPEQEKQTRFIRKSAEDLSDLVNDLLDLARANAGKLDVRPNRFTVAELLGALRGMLRPLLADDRVQLAIEEPGEPIEMETDERKVSQILRNLTVNALKFTEQGEVRVHAARQPESNAVSFTVRDTGIGIAPEHMRGIFEEFLQIENPMQRRMKGSGLGLPLSRKLAELLGGGIEAESRLGYGSVFRVTIPANFTTFKSTVAGAETPPTPAEGAA